MSTSGVDTVTVAARRRQRRLRAYLRYARMSVAMAWQRARTIPQRVRRMPGPGSGYEIYYTAKFRANPPPSRSSSSCARKSPAVPGHPVWVSRGGRRRRSSSASSSSSPTSYPWCRFWTLLGCWGREDQVLDVPAIEHFIAVPKISLDRVHPAFCPSSSAEGRTVGGSADGARISTGGPCRARHVAEGCNGIGGGVAELPEQIVNNPVPQGRRGRSGSPQGSLPRQRMWSRSLLFLLVEVSKVFSQARVPHRVDFS